MPTKSEKLRNKLLASIDDGKEPVDDAEWAAHEDQLSGKSGRRRKSPILSPIETDARGRIEGPSGATNHGAKYAATVSDDVEFQIVPQSRVSFDPEAVTDKSDDGSDKEASGAQQEIQQKRGRDAHNDPTSTKSSNMPSAAGSTVSNKQPDDSDLGSKPTKSRSKGISPPQDNLVLDNELPEDLDERILAAVYENLPVWAKSAVGAAKRQKTPVDDVLLAENARKQIHSNIRESITKRTGLSGENEDTKKIDKEITTHMGAILGEILRYPLNEAEKRQAITRVLQVRRRNGDYYEALGIKENAEQKEVGSAYRNLARLVYPDKNSDEEATNVAKFIGEAYETLRDKSKRSAYDRVRKLKPQKSAVSFDESFHPSAFGASGPGSDDEANTSSDDAQGDLDIPEPSEKVQEYHQAIEKPLEVLLKSFDQELDGLMTHVQTINKINKRIVKDNKGTGVPSRAYTISSQEVVFLRHALKEAAKAKFSKEAVTKLCSAVRNACDQANHQWPDEWKHIVLGIAKERRPQHASHQATGEPRPPQQAQRESPWGMRMGSSSAGAAVAAEDEDMADAEDIRIVKPFQPLVPGFTLMGDEIIGHKVFTRLNRFEDNKEFITGMGFFIKVREKNPLRYATTSQIGIGTAKAYLDSGKANLIEETVKKYKHRGHEDFGGIVGVTSPSKFCSHYRMPVTFIQVQVVSDTTEVHILTHTALDNWIGKDIAAKLVDDFFVGIGEHPPWAVPGKITTMSYIPALRYPRPSLRSLGQNQALIPHEVAQNNLHLHQRDSTADYSQLIELVSRLELKIENQQEAIDGMHQNLRLIMGE